MIPTQHQITLPAGIEDERSRVILELLESRFGAFPIERLLVYLFDHVPESALPALAWQFDIPAAIWATATTEQRRQLVTDAIAEQRLRGTIGATLRALIKAGGPEAFIQAADDVLYADGELYADGTFYAVSQKGTYWLVLVGAELIEADERARYITIAREWMRGTAHLHQVFSIPTAEEFGVLDEYVSLEVT